MASGKNTEEYGKVKKSFAKISKAIAGVIGPTCNELLSVGLITNDQKEAARNGMISVGDRASDVVSLILSKVDQDSQNFYTFVEVLKGDLDTFKTVLDHMGVSTGKLDLTIIILYIMTSCIGGHRAHSCTHTHIASYPAFPCFSRLHVQR